MVKSVKTDFTSQEGMSIAEEDFRFELDHKFRNLNETPQSIQDTSSYLLNIASSNL